MAAAVVVVGGCAGGDPGAPPDAVAEALAPTRSDAAGTWGDPGGPDRGSGRFWAVLDPGGRALVFDGCNTTGASSWRLTVDGTVVLGADAITTVVGCPWTVPTSFALDGDVLVGRADDGQTWRVDRTSVLPLDPSSGRVEQPR